MRILYATDGSKESLAGAELLARLPLEPDWPLVVLAVLGDEEKEDGERVVAPALERLRHATASLSHEVRRGAAAEEILRAAEEHPTDLIVVGSRGLHGIARFFLGSVAERVARHAHCPVLLARPIVHDLQRVIVGLDGSECARRAAKWIERFPMPEACEYRLTTVLPPREAALHGVDFAWPTVLPEFEAIYEKERKARRESLKALAAEFAAAGMRAVPAIETGDAAHVLLEEAEEKEADLIVVGSQGLTGLDRFILGSVSEKVMRYAHCSVLVVK